jgi:ribose transport system substrate-binding protein
VATASSGSAAFATSDPNLAAGSGDGKKIVYVPGLTGVPFYSSVSCGAASEAEKLGAEFVTQGDPTFAVDKQTAIVNALIADKPDAILISITDPEAMIGPLQEAKDAGIQVIGIDGDLTDESVMSTNIQSDNIIGGQMAADALAAAIGPDGGEVLILNNATGSLIGDARVKGFEDQLAAKYPNIKSLGQQYSANAADKAAGIVSAAAASNPNLKGIYGITTNNTQGAITGLAEAGRTGEVKLVGYDTSDPIIEGLRAGAVDGLVVQYPYGEGILGVQSAIKLMNGESVDRLQTTPFVIATKDNVDDPTVQQYIYKVDC